MAFARYALIGGVATATHYALLTLLVEGLQAPAGASAALGAGAGALVAYAGNRRFTFETSLASHARALPRFMAVATLGVVLSGLIVHWGSVVLGVHYLLAQALATVLVLILGYHVNHRWSFA